MGAAAGAVEHAAQQRRTGLVQELHAVQHLRDLDGARAQHIEHAVGGAGHVHAVGQQAAGRRVHDDIVGLFAQHIQHPAHGPRVDLPQVLRGLVTGQQPQLPRLLLQQHSGGSGGLLQRQRIVQTGGGLGDAHCQLDGGLAQVGVYKDHLGAVTAEGLGQIDGDGGLALAGHGAGHQNGFVFFVGQRPQQLDPQGADALLIGAGDAGIVDGQQLVGAILPPLEGHGGQGGQTLLIQLQAHVVAAADGAACGGDQQQQRQTHRQTQQRALAGAAQGTEAVIGLRGYRRLRQQLHACAAHHIVGSLRIYRDDGFKDRQRIVGIRAGDPQGEQIGICHRGSGDGAVDPINAHGLPQQGGEVVRLHQIGEGLAELLGSGFVIIAGGPGDVRDAAGADLNGEGDLAGVHGGIGPPRP